METTHTLTNDDPSLDLHPSNNLYPISTAKNQDSFFTKTPSFTSISFRRAVIDIFSSRKPKGVAVLVV